MSFIVTTLSFWNDEYTTHLMHRAGISYKYCARAFLPRKVWQIIDDGVRGQNALVRSVSLPKKAPLWTHPRFSLSSVHSLWCASRKRSSKTHSALHGYNFLMKSPNTFWQKYFLRKKNLWESRKFLTYQSGKTINKKGKAQVCQNFHFWNSCFCVCVLVCVNYCCESCLKVSGLRMQRCPVWSECRVDVIGVTSTFSPWRIWSPQRGELKRSPWKVL